MAKRQITTITLVSLALVVSVGWGTYQWQQRRAAETMLAAHYERQFFEVLGHMEGMEASLAKALVTASPQESMAHLTQLWRHALLAQANVGSLPLATEATLRTHRFLSQMGDFGYTLSEKMAQGTALSADDRRQLEQLHAEVSTMGVQLHGAVAGMADGVMPWGKGHHRRQFVLNPFAKMDGDVGEGNAFATINDHLIEVPTLVYDGPFSDHMLHRQPKGIDGEWINSMQARQIALEFVQRMTGERNELFTELAAETQEQSPFSAWNVSVRQAGQVAPFATLDVSQQGGHVLWMLNPRVLGQATLTLEEAEQRARQFMEEHKFTAFEMTYAVSDGQRAVVPFVAVEDDVLMYPDQMKVIVALDTGDIVGFDAAQYYTSHHRRDLPQPRLTGEEAQALVRADLQPETTRLALIPLAHGKEVLTYEVKARNGTGLYHVYVNAADGREERILKIVPSAQEGLLAV